MIPPWSLRMAEDILAAALSEAVSSTRLDLFDLLGVILPGLDSLTLEAGFVFKAGDAEVFGRAVL